MNIEKNFKLQHLSDVEVQKLIERYYNKEKIQDLIIEYNIECRDSELVKLFPPKVLDTFCPYCNEQMIENYVSRSQGKLYKETIYCPKCNHIYVDKNCSCDNCITLKKEIVSKKDKKVENLNYEDITDIEKIYLASILRGMEYNEIDENKIVFKPLNSSENKIAPTYEFEIEILTKLFDQGIISISGDSDIKAFTGNLVDEDFGESFYLSKVQYNLNIKYESCIVSPNINVTNDNIKDLYALVRLVVLDECYEYLLHQMEKIRFSFVPGKTTKEVFNELLDKFSLGQVYSIIYNSITNATRYYQEGNVSKKQAANSVITRCRAYGERAIANNWEIRVYSRPYECKQSLLSELLFNKIIKIGDQYSSTILDSEKITEYIVK